MAESISWSTTFDVLLGPRVSQSGIRAVAAYDKISVELAAGAVDIDLDVQPSAAAGEVEVLVVTAGDYEAGVTYSADAGATTVALDGPLALIGAGAVGLLADPPQTLRFANPASDPVTVDVLVGRQT